MNVDVAVLFWFYKDINVTKNHLELLKKNNPTLKIYGLYGGTESQVSHFKKALANLLDDFYVSPFKDSAWKWKNGDLVILDWYKKKGCSLEWESVVLVQWDMLVLGPISTWFPELKKDQFFLTGLCPLNKRIENVWHWTAPFSKERKNFTQFKKTLQSHFDYSDTMMASLFILGIFPRIFFEKYLTVTEPEIGFLEYKVPTYAKLFGIPLYERDLGTYWGDWVHIAGNFPLNALPVEIKESYIQKQLKKVDGWRLFHPFFKVWSEKENPNSMNVL